MVRNVADVVQPCENRQDEGMTCLRAMYRKGGPMRRLLNALVAALLCCTVMSATRAAPGEERRTLPFAFSVTKRGEGNFFRGDYIDYPLSQVAVKGEVWSFHTIAAYANPTPIVRYKGPDFEHLGAIDTALMWEFGPAIRGEGHRLVITPESRRDLRPLVRRILGLAPRLDGWEFYAYRPPEDFDMAEQTVKGRTGGSIAKTFFRAAVSEFNKVALLFSERDYVSAEDRQALNDVCVATETLPGGGDPGSLGRGHRGRPAGPRPGGAAGHQGAEECRGRPD